MAQEDSSIAEALRSFIITFLAFFLFFPPKISGGLYPIFVCFYAFGLSFIATFLLPYTYSLSRTGYRGPRLLVVLIAIYSLWRLYIYWIPGHIFFPLQYYLSVFLGILLSLYAIRSKQRI